jgi:hydrogenase expression/formation protein HypD
MSDQEQLAKSLAEKIEKLAAGRDIKIMHVCGTHEYTITKSGIRSLLPANVKVVMGPGCPVCVTPQSEIDAIVELAEQGKIITTYGDLLRVPGTKSSLYDSVGDIRIVQSIAQAVDIARQNPSKEVVFMAVGFETTAPTTAAILLANPPENFSSKPRFHLLACSRRGSHRTKARRPSPFPCRWSAFRWPHPGPV